jgi:hypothetical protein
MLGKLQSGPAVHQSTYSFYDNINQVVAAFFAILKNLLKIKKAA